jgi:hypothetical protein
MTLGELKYECLKLMGDDSDLTSLTVSTSEYDNKMLGAINRALRRIYDKDKLPITKLIISDGIVTNDEEQGYIFNGLPYNSLNTKVLNISQPILELIPFYVFSELKRDSGVGEANDCLNKFETFVSELPTPKINATTLGLQTSIVATYDFNNL